MVKIVSLNVRGLSSFKKRRIIVAWCRKMKTDVIFFQETHSKIETENQWEREWGGKFFFRTVLATPGALQFYLGMDSTSVLIPLKPIKRENFWLSKEM